MDDEAVKTLKRIEALLGKAFPSGSNKGASAGTADRPDRSSARGSSQIVKTRDAKEAAANKKQNKGILAVAKNLGTLEDVCQAASKSLFWMTQKTDKASISLTVFAKSLGISTGKLKANAASASKIPKPGKTPKQTTPIVPPTPKPEPKPKPEAKPGTKPKPKKEPDDSSMAEFQASLQRINKGVLTVLDDAFETMAARGYGAAGSLTEVYTSAIGVNMTLQEYAQLMDKNMIAVSRASSFAAFQKNLRVGTDSLRKFGVFGADAANLSATMMSASTSLGVPQAQLGEAMGKQIDVFEKFRKTVGVTAKGFQELVAELSANTQTVTELSALAPQERASRQAQLLEQMAYAQALGLSEAEQRKYTSSVLAQRQTTVKKRFELAGRLTQAAGLTGMSAGKTDELRTLAGKKYKTTDEQKRYQELMGELNTNFERMQQSGQISSQYMADTITEAIGAAGGKEALDTAAAIRAAKESGPQKNADIGKELGFLGQTIGAAMTTLGGLGKNPIVQAIGGIVAAIAALAIPTGTTMGIVAGNIIAGNKMFAGIGDMLKGKGGKGGGLGNRVGNMAGRAAGSASRAGVAGLSAVGLGGMLPNGTPSTPSFVGPPTPEIVGPPKPSALTKAGGLKGLAKGAVKGLPGISSALAVGLAGMDYMNAEETAAAGDGDVGKAKGEAIGEGAGAIIGGAIGALGGPLGIMAGAWAGGIAGKWLGAMAGSESATEKNTKELIKSTRAMAGETTVSANNLGSLGANVAATARAYTPPNEAELKKHAESKMTSAELAASRAKEAKEAKNTPVVKVEPVKAEPAKTTPVQATPVVKAEPVVTPVQALTPILATPATQVSTGVKPVEINKPVVQEPSPVKSALEAGTSALPVQDPGSVLSQILAILQQSLVAENLQVDLAGQLLRARALTPSLPDNQQMVKRVFAET